MAETVYVDTADEDADRLYHEFLKRFGLDGVGCQACTRALLPAPINLESYTFTARGGRSWTWDVANELEDAHWRQVLLRNANVAYQRCSTVTWGHC